MGNATGEQQKERRTGNKNGVQDRKQEQTWERQWETILGNKNGETREINENGHGKQELETIMVIKNGQQ